MSTWLERVALDAALPPPDHVEHLERVVVAGAGPAGLVAAVVLAERGVPVTVLEKLPGLSSESRASTFHPATLELLEDLDLAEEVVAAGLRAPTTQFRDRATGPIATFDLGVLAAETEFPFRVQLEQSKFTPMALRRLRELAATGDADVEVRFEHRTHQARLVDDRVELTVGTSDALVHIDAPWVIAADGAHSAVRESLGIRLEGAEYPERFLVVSVGNELAEHLDDLALVNYIADPEEWLVLLRTPDHWRVLFPVTSDAESSDELDADEASIRRRLDGVASLGEAWEVLDASVYVVSRRVVDTMRQGRVLLVGDAAHQNSPLGGMGMNSGIQDAVSAGRRLAEVWAGGSESLLDEFATRRRDVAVTHVQTDSHANWLALREPDPTERARLQAEIAGAAADPLQHLERMRRSAMLDAVRSGL